MGLKQPSWPTSYLKAFWLGLAKTFALLNLDGQCWQGAYQYDNCCEWPPWHEQYAGYCFTETIRNYDACCRLILGLSPEPSGNIVFLPARWTNAFILLYKDRPQIHVNQNISYEGWRHGPRRTRNRKGHVLYQHFDSGEESCVLFPEAEHMARAFLVGGIGHFWLQQSAPLRVLDLGTGIGIVPVAAALAGHYSVGVDFNPCMLEQAQKNILANHVADRAMVLNFDMCEGPLAFKARFQELLRNTETNRAGWFDVFVSTLALGATISITDCILELVAGLGSQELTLMQVNWPGYHDDRLQMVKQRAARFSIEHRAGIPLSLLGWVSPVRGMKDYELDIYQRRAT